MNGTVRTKSNKMHNFIPCKTITSAGEGTPPIKIVIFLIQKAGGGGGGGWI